nr:amidohydrolase family protein [Saprospiraceae bacterium]
MVFQKLLYIIAIVFLIGCKNPEISDAATLVIKNGIIYTADDKQPTAKVIAVKDGIIVYVGEDESKISTDANTKIIDLNGKTLTPGFIEGHGHILGIGYNEMNLDLINVKNYDELLDRVKEAVAVAEPGQWIVGRGWHQ